ncbi:MAG TPA: class I SAM-dependent methyltransferase [Gammaproteobacteria bacterium]|nr:class I SAM-dependent methyltransferase [Gammaproteobacteria bacterium]
MTASSNQPDWDLIAEKFDLWLPHIAPVGEGLLTALKARAGDQILDVASGTGEPALTLARRFEGRLNIVGIDAAEAMARVAQNKVEQEGLKNVRFQCMAAEHMDFPDEHFDRVLCRFGVMLFDEPLQGLKEMHRVLKRGGTFALAVWGEPETMPTLHWTFEVLKNRLPEDLHPPLAKVTSLGGEGVLAGLLKEAGFVDFSVTRSRFEYQFPDFDAYWDVVEASDIMKNQFDALSAAERDAVRDEVGAFARHCVQDGQLRIPHEYLLAAGRR